jgi:hypothetical protein
MSGGLQGSGSIIVPRRHASAPLPKTARGTTAKPPSGPTMNDRYRVS